MCIKYVTPGVCGSKKSLKGNRCLKCQSQRELINTFELLFKQ